MSDQPEQTQTQDISRLLYPLREQRVILDADLAQLYGVTTKRLNEQYRRNVGRFPQDFAFQVTAEEWTPLRSQIATLKTGRGSHRKYLPLAFTEHGALMVANILNSPRAVVMSVYVIRAFVKMREVQTANSAIFKRLAEIDKTLMVHDAALRDVYQKLRPLLEPPALPPKPAIGFHVKEDSVLYRVKRKSARP